MLCEVWEMLLLELVVVVALMTLVLLQVVMHLLLEFVLEVVLMTGPWLRKKQFVVVTTQMIDQPIEVLTHLRMLVPIKAPIKRQIYMKCKVQQVEPMKPIQKSEHQTSQFQEAINHVNVNVDVEENHTDASYVVQADPTTEDVAKASDQAVVDPMVEKVVGQATPG